MHAESRRLASVQTPVIPIVGQWTRETPGTISLGQGLVSYGPPAEAIDAVRQFGGSIADHHYGPLEGLPPLVDAIEDKLARENGIRVRPSSRVVVTAGGNLAFMNAVLAVTDPGDEVVLPVPYYFNHEMAVTMAGARPVPVRTTSARQLDLGAIADAISERTRAVVTVSPNNPTGAVYPELDLRALNALCRDRGVFHIHDEVYEYFVNGQTPHFSPGSIEGAGKYTISLFSLSKAYGMASWRVGYMVIPELLLEALLKIQDTILICAASVSQVAATAAMRVGRRYVDGRRARLATMGAKIGAALRDPAVPCVVPPSAGAFYYFPMVSTRLDAMTLTERLIREYRVAVVPGTAFGDAESCSIRVSYGALDEATAEEGTSRLVRGLQALAVA